MTAPDDNKYNNPDYKAPEMPPARGWQEIPPGQNRKFWAEGFWAEGKGAVSANANLNAVSTSTSAAAAIVSVTKTISYEEINELIAEFNQLKMPALKALAAGAELAWDIPPGSKLTPEVVKLIALSTYDDRDRKYRRNTELIKWGLGFLGAVALAFLTWYLGRHST
jgi:hypothetical protein